MQQGSDPWLEWRKKGIGSSDAPIIMGVSPWSTPWQLFMEKTGQAEPKEASSFILDRGNELEPIARARYELEADIDMPAGICQHKTHRWMRASMDGWNQAANRGLEIKFVGVNDFELAKQGVVPHKYFPQIQHQFMVTGAESIDFYAYSVPKGVENHQGSGVIVKMFPDLAYIEKLYDEETTFWSNVLTNTPPPFIQLDYKWLRMKGAKALSVEWEKTRSDEIKEQLFALAGDLIRFRIGNLRSEWKEGKRTIYVTEEAKIEDSNE